MVQNETYSRELRFPRVSIDPFGYWGAPRKEVATGEVNLIHQDETINSLSESNIDYASDAANKLHIDCLRRQHEAHSEHLKRTYMNYRHTGYIKTDSMNVDKIVEDNSKRVDIPDVNIKKIAEAESKMKKSIIKSIKGLWK